jgi:exodeoxyribonuclease V alpha subunit
MKVQCKHSFTIYEKNAYKVVLYSPTGELTTPDGKTVSSFKAVGDNLPTNPALEFVLSGDWKLRRDKDQKDQWSFVVAAYDEIMPNSKDGIIKYLSTLKGIGKVTAAKIYSRFGADVLDVLEKDPDKLLEVSGISKKSLDKVKAALAENGTAKDLFAYLYTFDIPTNKIMQVLNRYGEKALANVKEYPYELTQIAGLGFKTADKIAHSNGLPADSKERIEAGILEVLLQAENGGSLFKREVTGHMYLEWNPLVDKLLDLLSVKIPYEQIAKVCMEMREKKKIFIADNKYFYRYQSASAEYGIARHILRILRYEVNAKDNKKAIASVEANLRVKLASEQLCAVETSLNNTISVITGGPGTGKTMIQKILIEVFLKIKPAGKVVLAAPTGQAARKMSDSTGYPSSTIHQLLGLYATDDEEIKTTKEENTYVEADLVLIDESSMLDTALAFKLFSSIRQGTQVVIVGDVNQLPSVGAGCVLRALINSRSIPTVYLTRVYRQKKGSSIAVNAARINSGETNLEYDEDFCFHNVNSNEEIINAIKKVYKELVNTAGIDEVMVLSPFRQKTETGVDSLNMILRDLVLPHSASDKKLTCGKKSYYAGDKVMQTKNTLDLANGDIGYIKAVKHDGDGTFVEAVFDDREFEYYVEDAADLDLAYASTVHKAQGSESKYAILIVSEEHKILLKRNLLYTAATRAKFGLIIIGSLKAFLDAIKTEDVSMRNTRLDIIIHDYTKDLIEKQLTIA